MGGGMAIRNGQLYRNSSWRWWIGSSILVFEHFNKNSEDVLIGFRSVSHLVWVTHLFWSSISWVEAWLYEMVSYDIAIPHKRYGLGASFLFAGGCFGMCSEEVSIGSNSVGNFIWVTEYEKHGGAYVCADMNVLCCQSLASYASPWLSWGHISAIARQSVAFCPRLWTTYIDCFSPLGVLSTKSTCMFAWRWKFFADI